MRVTTLPILESVHLYGDSASWADASPSVLAILFGEMLKRGLPVMRHYRSDLYHDAIWLHENVTGPATFEWLVRESGTHIGDVVGDAVKVMGNDPASALFAIRLFVRPGTAGVYRATFARLSIEAELKRTSDSAREIGLHQGWSAANYSEAYHTTKETPEAEAFRRANEQLSYARGDWESGFLEGWQLHTDGLWQDGTPVDDAE